MQRQQLEDWEDDEDGFVQSIQVTEDPEEFDEYSDGENEQEFEEAGYEGDNDGDWELNDSYEGDSEGEHNIEIEIHHSFPDDGNLQVDIEVVNHPNRTLQVNATQIYTETEDGDEGLEENQSYMGEEEMEYDSFTDGDENFDDFTDEEVVPEVQSDRPIVIINNGDSYNLSDYKLPQGGVEKVPIITPQNQHWFEDCSICFAPIYKKGYNSCYLECLHWYHFGCLNTWCSHSRNCPVCRTQFVNILKVK